MKNFLLKLFIVSFILKMPHGGSAVGAFPKPCSHQLFAYEQGFSSRAVLETRHAPHAGSSSFSLLPSMVGTRALKIPGTHASVDASHYRYGY
jgi:hypothetical protein